jgi:hypothetical protein
LNTHTPFARANRLGEPVPQKSREFLFVIVYSKLNLLSRLESLSGVRVKDWDEYNAPSLSPRTT